MFGYTAYWQKSCCSEKKIKINMKTFGKIMLAIAAGAAAATIYRRRASLQNAVEEFTAPDGKKYKKNQTYKTAEGEMYRNGHRLHTDRGQVAPQEHFANTHHHDYGKIHSNFKVNHDVAYHNRGTRHK